MGESTMEERLIFPDKEDQIILWLFNVAMENGPFMDGLWWFTY